MKKTAIVLFNLGGPDNLEAVGPFLSNLFGDPAIIRLPSPFRKIIAWLLVKKRIREAQNIYAQIGGCSPILANTEAQAAELEKKLAGIGKVRCFVAMRYWHPFAEETAKKVQNFMPDQIILLPLYPQFSTTTTQSSFSSWDQAVRAIGMDLPTEKINSYPDEPGFIESLACSVRASYEKAKSHGSPRLLFSAHGLPEKIIKAGDPYQLQCEQTARSLAQTIGIPELDWTLCYQSRVGPLKWIGPSTEEEIIRAGHNKVSLIIVPIAFVSEHSETLVEIDITYRKLAAGSGVPYFDRVATAGTGPDFIEGLANLVRKAIATRNQ